MVQLEYDDICDRLELRDILTEAGFKKVHLYWEGTNRAGGGDGKFKRVEEGESCLSWIAYLAAEA